jgi:5-methylcytosine-specific restriction enzyme subunit McrC
MEVSSPIPIKSLYYMLCYAWDKYNEGLLIGRHVEDSPDLPNLLAKMLINGIRHINRHGLDKGYVSKNERSSCLRGRILLGDTLKDLSHLQARAYCSFDELEIDILPNQIIKTSILTLINADRLAREVKQQLHEVFGLFRGVSSIVLNARSFGMVRFHRNNRLYSLLIRVCEMVFRILMPTQSAGHYRFYDAVQDDRWMAGVFEEFVRNFYRNEQSTFRVVRERIEWLSAAVEPGSNRLLPSMITDISLRSPSRTVIVDCKFYRKTLQEYQGSTSIHSGHLYQIFAYLRNVEQLSSQNRLAEGILLYPRTDVDLNLHFDLHGHRVHVYTINLAQEWKQIGEDLQKLIRD